MLFSFFCCFSLSLLWLYCYEIKININSCKRTQRCRVGRHYCDVAKPTTVTETHRCSQFLSLVVEGFSLVREDFTQYTDDQLQSLIRRWATTAYDDSPNCRFTKYHFSTGYISLFGCA